MGTITAAANAGDDRILVTGLPSSAKLINASGTWLYYTDAGYMMGIGDSQEGNNASAIVLDSNSGAIRLRTITMFARTNLPYEVYLDWTDGTVR